MEYMCEKFHSQNQCLFWKVRIMEFTGMSSKMLDAVIEDLEKEGVCTRVTEVSCEECGYGWRGHPDKGPSRCRGCGDSFEKDLGRGEDTFVLNREWAEARRWFGP